MGSFAYEVHQAIKGDAKPKDSAKYRRVPQAPAPLADAGARRPRKKGEVLGGVDEFGMMKPESE